MTTRAVALHAISRPRASAPCGASAARGERDVRGCSLRAPHPRVQGETRPAGLPGEGREPPYRGALTLGRLDTVEPSPLGRLEAGHRLAERVVPGLFLGHVEAVGGDGE